MKSLLRLAAILTVLCGCGLKPTKGELHREYRPEELQITAMTVLLDARSAFDYQIAHVPKSLNLEWQDFTQDDGHSSGLLKSDVAAMIQRISLLGIGTDTPVIIIGAGKNGHGEEGRLAWTLFYLGVRNVKCVGISYFGTKLTQADSDILENAVEWKPSVHSEVLVSRDQFMAELFPRGKPRAADLHVIDVRTKKEFFDGKTPDLSAVNIDWREFLDANGRPNKSIVKKLKAIGVNESDRIFVVSNHGVRSAEVVMALLEMGFSHTANFAGGFLQLESKSR